MTGNFSSVNLKDKSGNRSNISNVSGAISTREKTQNTRNIYTKNYQPLDTDDIAQVKEIFIHFDPGHRGKISIEYLPKILRLLNYNIGKSELQDL